MSTMFESLKLFEAQLRLRTALKVVLMPCAVVEAGPVVKVSLRKPYRDTNKARDRRLGEPLTVRTLRLRVAVDCVIESEIGLKQAMDAIETLSGYLIGTARLEDDEGNPIANTRIETKTNEDDGILEDPESGDKAWVREEFSVDIQLA